MSKKITWNVIYNDFKSRHPNLKKEVVYWRPHDYATILLYLKAGRYATYNYDKREVRFLGGTWLHKVDS